MSAPSPDAKVTGEENPELIEDLWSIEQNLLTNTGLAMYSSKSNDLSTGLKGYVRSQKAKYPARDIDVGELIR
jgi:hypothetical protein